jgi:hypothetical protein
MEQKVRYTSSRARVKCANSAVSNTFDWVQGWSGLVWDDFPDVPCLRDDSTISGVLCESDSTIVKNVCYFIGPFVTVCAVFTIGVLLDNYFVAYVVRMG